MLVRSRLPIGANNDEKDAIPMVDILNLALPYFGLIFIGFACGKAKGLPEAGSGVDEPFGRAQFLSGARVKRVIPRAVNT